MSNMPFQPPTGLIGDDTVFSAPGRWRNSSMIRFWQGTWEVKGGWERLSLENLGGVCRAVLGWTNSQDYQTVAFGLHNALKVWRDSLISDITPLYQHRPVALIADPFTTTNAIALVQVQLADHGLEIGDSVAFSGAAVFNGVDLNGTFAVVGVLNTFTFSINAPNAANASTTGGGPAVVMQDQAPWEGGQIDGTGGAGYGTGAYGVGEYGEPSTADYFPLTWSLATYGGNLMANPRNQGIYFWEGDPLVPAALIEAAPKQVTYMTVNPQRQVMAFGCNEEASGVFNPLCVRWSDIENYDDWTTAADNNAGEWILESGGRIVCARMIGDYALVWTTVSLFLGTFLGNPGQTWKFERVGANCGSISPGGPVVRGQNVMWLAPDVTFWTYSLGGAPSIVPSPISLMFKDNLAQGQNDKIVGGTISSFGEVVFFYADSRDGLEVSRSLVIGSEGWSRDLLSRSAWVDAGPQPNPIGVSPTGWAYWHEKGRSADGGALSGFIESTDFYISEADGGLMVNGIWPDFKNQVGIFKLTIYGREHPQAVERVYGPWSLQPGQGRRSFRLAARIARVRFDFSSAPCFARGGKPEFDTQGIGGR